MCSISLYLFLSLQHLSLLNFFFEEKRNFFQISITRDVEDTFNVRIFDDIRVMDSED